MPRFKCLGQIQIRSLLAYATVAQVSMLWGLTTVFSTLSPWLIPFGVNHRLGHDRSPSDVSLHSTEVWCSCHWNPARIGHGYASTGGVIDHSDQHRCRASPYSGIVRIGCLTDSRQSGCLPCHHVRHYLLRVDLWNLVFFTS